MSDEDKLAKVAPIQAEEEKKEESIDERRAAQAAEQDALAKKPSDLAPLPDTEELSEEDRKLKEDLELLVSRILDPGPDNQEELRRASLELLIKEIRTSTATMTSVPKPLKFLTPHYQPLVTFYESQAPSDTKKQLADVLSILAITMGKPGARESLKYKLAGSDNTLTLWGAEYVKSLSGEISAEFLVREEEAAPTDDLMACVDQIVPFQMSHNAVIEAIDLLTEVNDLTRLKPYVTKANVSRVGKYLVACAPLVHDPDERLALLNFAYDAYRGQKELSEAIRIAMLLNDKSRMLECLNMAADDRAVQKQLAFMLSWHKVTFESDQLDDDELNEIIGNVQLHSMYARLARDLDSVEPKSPDEIFKTHLEEGKPRLLLGAAAGASNKPQVDSAKQNLASTFANAFVNCGYCKDTLVTPEGSDWLYKNKQDGMLSAAASVGMLNLWDVENGFNEVDKYSFSQQNYIKAGVLLATGIVSSGVTSEMDAAMALLSEHIESPDATIKISAVLGLGLGYAGCPREDILEALTPLILDESQSIEIASIASLALGLVYVGTSDEGVVGNLTQAIMDRTPKEMADPVARLMCLGLGLVFLGKGEDVESVLNVIEIIEQPIKPYLTQTVRTCAYLGTGNVEEVQKLLSVLADHIKDDDAVTENKEDEEPAAAAAAAGAPKPAAKKDPTIPKGMHQEAALLGLAMVVMGEELGTEMALRSLDNILQYGEVNLRRVVPLALGLLSISNPRIGVVDTMSKLTHDQDQIVSQNACLCMGFIGAGTNNSRIAKLLRELAGFYSKEPNHLFLIRLAQGLLHMGQGLLTLNPHHSDNAILSKIAVAGLLSVFHACLDMQNTILSKRHYLLFSLVTAARPRCLITVDEDLQPLPTKVLVGAAVDTVGTLGKARSITGFQQRTTPLVLGNGERAELYNDEYLALTTVLEGVVILRKNPHFREEKA